MDAIQVEQMSVTDATALHERIINGFKGMRGADAKLRHLLYDFDKGQGWDAMGYGSLWDCFKNRLKHEFGVTPSWMCQLIGQATAEKQLEIAPKEATKARLSKHVTNLALSGRALSQLAKLNAQPEDQKKAFEKARLRAGINPINEKLVKDAVKPFLKPKEESLSPGMADPITKYERIFNVVRDIRSSIRECKKLDAPEDVVPNLSAALKLLEPWLETLK